MNFFPRPNEKDYDMPRIADHSPKYKRVVPRQPVRQHQESLPAYRRGPQNSIECAYAARWRLAFARFGDECARRHRLGTVPNKFSQGVRS